MGNVFATVVESNLKISAKEGPVHFGAKPRVGRTSFTAFFSNVDEEQSPQPTETERKSTTFLSWSENLSHPHPPRPSGIRMDPFRPPNPNVVASKKCPALFLPLRAIRTFDPSLND
jgi:hypothetical protein